MLRFWNFFLFIIEKYFFFHEWIGKESVVANIVPLDETMEQRSCRKLPFSIKKYL